MKDTKLNLNDDIADVVPTGATKEYEQYVDSHAGLIKHLEVMQKAGKTTTVRLRDPATKEPIIIKLVPNGPDDMILTVTANDKKALIEAKRLRALEKATDSGIILSSFNRTGPTEGINGGWFLVTHALWFKMLVCDGIDLKGDSRWQYENTTEYFKVSRLIEEKYPLYKTTNRKEWSHGSKGQETINFVV